MLPFFLGLPIRIIDLILCSQTFLKVNLILELNARLHRFKILVQSVDNFIKIPLPGIFRFK